MSELALAFDQIAANAKSSLYKGTPFEFPENCKGLYRQWEINDPIAVRLEVLFNDCVLNKCRPPTDISKIEGWADPSGQFIGNITNDEGFGIAVFESFAIGYR